MLCFIVSLVVGACIFLGVFYGVKPKTNGGLQLISVMVSKELSDVTTSK